MPVWLADADGVAGGFEGGDIAGFVARIGNDDEDVDNRFGEEAGDGGGADVFEDEGAVADGDGVEIGVGG